MDTLKILKNKALVLSAGLVLVGGGGVALAQQVTQDQLTPQQAQQLQQQRQAQQQVNQTQRQAPQPNATPQGQLPALTNPQQTQQGNASLVGNKITVPNAGPEWKGDKLSKDKRELQGPSGNESSTNEEIAELVKKAKDAGIEGEYKVDDNGIKYLGNKVIVFANQKLNGRHFGDTIDTSLGEGIVLGEAGVGTKDPTQIKIAVDWDVN